MKKLLFIAALCVVLAVTNRVIADQMRGVVVEVDAAKNELTIEGRGLGKRGKSFTFALGKDIRIMCGSDKGTPDDLTKGVSVQITFDLQGGQRRATTIATNGERRAIPAVEGNTLAGLLRRVALTEREIVVAYAGDDGKEVYVSLPVAADAKITRDDKEIKFDDLKEEERASVRFEMRDGKKVAVAVAVGKIAANVPAAAAPADPNEPSKIAKLRMILKIADVILEQVERQQDKK